MDTWSQKYVCVSVSIHLYTYMKGKNRDGEDVRGKEGGRETSKTEVAHPSPYPLL